MPNVLRSLHSVLRRDADVIPAAALYTPCLLLGVTCLFGEMLFSTASNVLLRIATNTLPTEVTIFLRLSLAALIMTPFLLGTRAGRGRIRTCLTDRRRLTFYVLCGLVNYLGSLAWLFAIVSLPLATATSLFFTTALFMLVMSHSMLSEPFTSRRLVATVIGTIGVILVLRPSFSGIQATGAIAALAAAALVALARTQLKSLGPQETPAMSALLRFAPVIPVAALPAIRLWATPPAPMIVAILAASLLSIASQTAVAKAYTVLSLSQASALEYVRLLFATAAGILVFGERVEAHTLAGGAVIAAASLIGTTRAQRVPSKDDEMTLTIAGDNRLHRGLHAERD